MVLEGIVELLIENLISLFFGKKKYLLSNFCFFLCIIILISVFFIGFLLGLVVFICIRKGNNKREMRFKRSSI